MDPVVTTTGTAELRIYHHFIGGTDVEPDTNRFLDKVNPASGEVDAMIAQGSKGDVNKAVKTAQQAFEPWRRMDGAERRACLRKMVDVLDEFHSTLAFLDCADVGKCLNDATEEVERAKKIWSYYGQLAGQLDGAVRGAEGSTCMSVREPLGVVGIILPWASPVLQFSEYVAAAIACGNTVVVKPSEHGPRSALKLASLCQSCGLPDGVVNVVTGDGPGTGEALARHPGVNHVCFAGSSEIGKLVADIAASRLATCTCELSAKNAAIVFPEADEDQVVEQIVRGMCRNQGQSNMSISRLIIHQRIKKSFMKKLLVAVRKVRVGNPNDEHSGMGCIVNGDQMDRIECFVRLAKEEGAQLLYGGKRPENPKLKGGLYYLPTLFDNVTEEMSISQEEIFGPVLTISSFQETAKAIQLANSTRYGLCAWVYTRDLDTVQRLCRDLNTGRILVNQASCTCPSMPFSARGESGLGTNLGESAIAALTRAKWIAIGEHADE